MVRNLRVLALAGLLLSGCEKCDESNNQDTPDKLKSKLHQALIVDRNKDEYIECFSSSKSEFSYYAFEFERYQRIEQISFILKDKFGEYAVADFNLIQLAESQFRLRPFESDLQNWKVVKDKSLDAFKLLIPAKFSNKQVTMRLKYNSDRNAWVIERGRIVGSRSYLSKLEKYDAYIAEISSKGNSDSLQLLKAKFLQDVLGYDLDEFRKVSIDDYYDSVFYEDPKKDDISMIMDEVDKQPLHIDFKTQNSPLFNSIKLSLTSVKPGSFITSNIDASNSTDKGKFKTSLNYPYWIGTYEITLREYLIYLKSGGYDFGVDWLDETCPLVKNNGYDLSGNIWGEQLQQPMTEVSWEGAIAFCNWLTRREEGSLPEGYMYRLPTEAEWMFAAKGGNYSKGFIYSGSNRLEDVARPESNATFPVGLQKPNELGLYDMTGNVQEWCYDFYGKIKNEILVNPVNLTNDIHQYILKGGNNDYHQRYLTLAGRTADKGYMKRRNRGFRIVVAPEVDKLNEIPPIKK